MNIESLTLALLLTASTLACSAFRGPLTPPERGGAPWVELTSPHFLLKTDVEPPEARTVLAELERSYAALAHVMRRRPREAEAAIEVVLFARDSDFFEIAGQERTKVAYIALSLPADLEPRPVVVMRTSDLVEETRMTLQHELAHRFLHEIYPSLSPWLDEGLAQYYSSLRVSDGRISVGAFASFDFSERPYFWFASKGNLPQGQIPVYLAPKVEQLIRRERLDFYGPSGVDKVSNKDRERVSASYAGAWRLVHLLMNGQNADQAIKKVMQALAGRA